MAQYLVRHAVLQYRSKNALGQDTFETAFRGMFVELTDEGEIDRFKKYGAIVDLEENLTRPGQMLSLPDTATDSEILSWVTGATVEETEMLVRERPVMADRILAAQESVKQRFEEQAQHLGGLKAIAKETQESESAALNVTTDNSAGLAPAPQPSATDRPAVNDPGEVPNVASGPGQILANDGSLSDEEADKIVSGPVKSVTEYISENPRHAQAILSAENRRSDETRVSVVRAVQAASAFGA